MSYPLIKWSFWPDPVFGPKLQNSSERVMKSFEYLQPYRLRTPSNQEGSLAGGAPGTAGIHPSDTATTSCQSD